MYFAYKRTLEINRAYKYKAAPTPSAELMIIGKLSVREIRPLSEDGHVSKACFQAALLFSGECLLSIWKSESARWCTQNSPKEMPWPVNI